MISLTYTQYGSLQYGSRRQGKSLAFFAYHVSSAETMDSILFKLPNLGQWCASGQQQTLTAYGEAAESACMEIRLYHKTD
jgi:hypothetical protein